MDHLARAHVAHDMCGQIKLVADSTTGKLLGAHLLTPDAGEVIPTATLAVKHRLTIDDLVATLFPYLTYAEGLRLAAVSFDKDLSKLSCCVCPRSTAMKARHAISNSARHHGELVKVLAESHGLRAQRTRSSQDPRTAINPTTIS